MSPLRLLLSYIPGSLLGPMMSIASAVVFTRGMTPADYGRFTLVTTAATLASVCLAQWLSQSLLRYLPAAGSPQESLAIRSTGETIALYLALASMLAAGLVFCLPLDASSLYGAATLFAGAMSLVTIHSAILQAEMKGRLYSFLMGLSSVLKFALPAAVMFFAPSVCGMVFAASLALFAASVAAALIQGKHLYRVRLKVDRQLLGAFCRYGIPLIGWLFVVNLLVMSDRYLIGIYCSTADVGIYSANYTLAAGGVSLLGSPVALVLHPKLMQASRREGDKLAGVWLGRIFWAQCLVTVLGTAILYLVGGGIAHLVLSRQFAAGYQVIPVVFFASMILQIGLYLHKPFEFRGKTLEMLLYIGIAAAVNIGLNIALLPRYGYYVASWTTVVGALVYALLCGVRARKDIQWGMPDLAAALRHGVAAWYGRGNPLLSSVSEKNEPARVFGGAGLSAPSESTSDEV